MKRIVTPFLLLMLLIVFAACNEKEFETPQNQPEITARATETHLLIYQLGIGSWQEMPCDSETLRASLEKLVWLSVAEGVSVSVYDKFGDPTGDPPAYMPEKMETTDIDKFVDYLAYWLEIGYRVEWTYDPDTKTYKGVAYPQE